MLDKMWTLSAISMLLLITSAAAVYTGAAKSQLLPNEAIFYDDEEPYPALAESQQQSSHEDASTHADGALNDDPSIHSPNSIDPFDDENLGDISRLLEDSEDPSVHGDDAFYQDEQPAAYPEEPSLYQEEHPLYSQSVQMTSEPQHVRVREGARVSLPCSWDRSALEPDDDVVVLWKKLPSAILFTDRIEMSPNERLRVASDNSLQIRDVQAADAGTYACALSLPPRPPQVEHTLTVLLPASLDPDAPDHYKLKDGQKFELVCRAHGVPEPTVSWSKLPVDETEGLYFDHGMALETTNVPEGDDLAYLQQQPEKGIAVAFDPVRPHHAGTYTCTAQNGIGRPVSRNTRVEVVHAPYIAVETKVVRTAKGLEAEVSCKVYANPRAEVRWQRDGEPLPVNPSYETTVSRRFFSLKIRHVQDADLGNYTCRATNELGVSENHVQLTGLPSPLELVLSQPEQLANGSYSCRLAWQLVSFSQLQRVSVTLQQLPAAGSAARALELPIPPTRSVARSGMATLAPLAAGVQYHLTASAANGYGSTPTVSRQFEISPDGELMVMKETPRLAKSVSAAEAERLARAKLTPILLIGILSCFLW